MATIRIEIQELQDALITPLSTIAANTTTMVFLMGELEGKIDTLNFNVNEIYERLAVLENLLPAINRVGDLVNGLNILTGGATYNLQTKNVLDELLVQGNTLLAIAAALGLIKADTGNISTIDQRLSSFIGFSDMDSLGSLINQVVIQGTNTNKFLYSGQDGSFGVPNNPLATLMQLLLTNLGNIEQSENGSTLLLSDLKVQSLAANELLEEIRDCGCDDAVGTGLCFDYTSTAPGVPNATQAGQNAVTYQEPGTTDGYDCPHMFSFPAWMSGSNVTTYQNGEWRTVGTSTIYGPGQFNVAIANTGTVELTLFKGNLEAPGWNATPLIPNQCVLFNSDGWDFFCVGTLPDSLLSDAACEIRYGTPG